MVTVLVPAYNEGETVAGTLHRVAEVLRAELRDRSWEIVVVDDGSVDDTAAHASAAADALRVTGMPVRVLRHVANRGLGGALQTGFEASTGGVVVVVDCDLSYHPDHIPALVRALEADRAQLAVASPYMPGGRTLGVPTSIERRSRAANRFLARASNTQLHTLTGMVRAYDGPFVRELALKATDDVINVEALYKTLMLRGRVVEVPATLDWRGLQTRAGRSRLQDRRTRTKTYHTLVSGLLFRPYLLFILGGLTMIGLGGMLGLAAIFLPGTQLGLTVLGVSLLGTGTLVAFAAVLSVQVKRYFEELYYLQSGARAMIDRLAPDPESLLPRTASYRGAAVSSAAGPGPAATDVPGLSLVPAQQNPAVATPAITTAASIQDHGAGQVW